MREKDASTRPKYSENTRAHLKHTYLTPRRDVYTNVRTLECQVGDIRDGVLMQVM